MKKSKKLTTRSGAPVVDNQNVLTAGPRGPQLLQDVWFLEKLAHFDREVIPDVSRSASNIIVGLVLGLMRKTIVEFSFLLAVPTMAAATGYDLLKNASQFSFDQVQFLAIGFVMSFIVALVSIKFLLRFIQAHTFIPFGIYRIALVLLWVSLLY